MRKSIIIRLKNKYVIIIIIIIIILFHYHKGLRAVGLSLPTGSLGFVTLSFNCISQRCINYESHQEEYPIRNKRDRGGTGGIECGLCVLIKGVCEEGRRPQRYDFPYQWRL